MATRSNFPNRVEKRRSEAKIRQSVSDRLSLEDKLKKATVGSREYTRLLAKISQK